MSKEVIKFNSFITLKEAAKAIMLYGEDITQTFISEPGIGKTSLLVNTAIENGDEWRKIGDDYPNDKYIYIYLEAPAKDVPDMWLGIPDIQEKQITTVINELFKMGDPRPKIIMIDEELKATKLMKTLLARLKLERTAGDRLLPQGSIIFTTSNNPEDGVGDQLEAHGINRQTIHYVLKDNNKQWVKNFAMPNNIDSAIISWALFNPRAFESYMTLSKEKLDANDMIFSPYRPVQPFLSLRSLTKCDIIVRNRHLAGDNLTRSALYGTVGKSAGESIMQHLDMVNDLVSFDDIIKAPTEVDVPQSVAAQIHVLMNGVKDIKTQDDLSSFMKFVVRISSAELQSLFNVMFYQENRKLANGNPEIQKWLMSNKNHELLA